MVAPEVIKEKYPLHWFVWHNDASKLEELLQEKLHDIETKDNRGRTPLMLAVTLGHYDSVKLLLKYDANVNCENPDGWTVVQEAVAHGDPEILHMVVEKRDFQRNEVGICLKQAPDFYVEMKWEFTSWVPLVSRMCPSDTYKVYKQGSNVRIDTTLLGFDHTSWQRGNRSYVFQGHNDGATMMEIDHEAKQVYCEQMKSPPDSMSSLPAEENICHRFASPIVTTYVDTDKISFERNKAGMWGWRSDKMENVNGHDCKVFSATNVELVTKTRTEHMSEKDKAKLKNNKSPLQNFLGITEVEQTTTSNLPKIDYHRNEHQCLSPEDYFDPKYDLSTMDIGRPRELIIGTNISRPRELNTKVQKFKATLWLSESYPLSLPEQILPIVDLMAISSSHFAKLRNFIQMQLPSGFPVKIEIPLFHVLNARITFGNIFGMDRDIPNVTRIEEEDRLSCILDDSIFQCPAGYAQLGNVASESRRQFSMEEEDELLQFAIQQSLIEAGTEKEEVDIWEALKAKAQRPSRPATPNIAEEERQLQRAIQASLAIYNHNSSIESETNSPDIDSDLDIALRLSEEEQRQLEQQRQQEQQMLEKVLALSLTEK
ncbi:Ankyrin repeats (3 copies) [Popillia japonica]|uniref:Ankyrin repeats (3 copies) n=1 Tax=Popillia japonica TaxID=7064 RepID=A0AAW1L646_POPJA